jgi:hypothetical protein
MAARCADRCSFDRHVIATIATLSIFATNVDADDDDACLDADAFALCV